MDPRWLCFLSSLALSLVLTALVRRLAPMLGLVDQPDPRKVHKVPTPRAGGLAIFAAFALCFPCWPEAFFWLPFRRFALLAAAIVALGALDDRWPLPWWLRLGIQTVLAYLAVQGGVPGPLQAVAVFWIVGLVNAFNMLDNMDALSAGVAWIVLAGFLALSRSGSPGHRLTGEGVTCLLLLGAIAGFLWFNRPPASIFMGDSGSTLLGFAVGVSGVGIAAATPQQLPTGVLLLCAVPWYDLLSVVTIRLSQGRSPFHPDKQHLSHRLVLRGWSNPAAVALLHLLTLASAAGGVVLYAMNEMTWFWPAAAAWAAFACWDAWAWRRRP